MKVRNREVNIFSMSALDLFASGMGAFILLAFVALPFFPFTATDEAVQVLQSELGRAQAERDEAEKQRDDALEVAEELAGRLSSLEVPELDLVICLDVTGSMRDEIESLKSQVSSLARILNKITPTGIGVVAFGDDDWSTPLYVQEITTDIAELQAFLEKLEPGMNQTGNDDPAEAVSEALERAEGMRGRPEAELRHVVVITDNPAENRPAALAAAARFGADPEERVSAVLLRDNRGAEEFLRDLAERGGGEFVDGNRRSIVGAILLAVL